jgi:hypothetical protein
MLRIIGHRVMRSTSETVDVVSVVGRLAAPPLGTGRLTYRTA